MEAGACPPDEVRAQVERVLARPPLAGKPQLGRLLRYLVEGYFRDPGHAPVQYAVGVEALGLPADLDTETRSVVRVAMNRLRRGIEAYYREAGAEDPIVLRLSPTGYRVKVFRKDRPGRRSAVAPERIRLAVWYEREAAGSSAAEFPGHAVASELVPALRRCRHLEVLGPLGFGDSPDPWERAHTLRCAFLVVVAGTDLGNRPGIRLELWENRGHSLLASFRPGLDEREKAGSFLAKITERFAEEVGGDYGWIDRYLQALHPRQALPASPFAEALLAGKHFGNVLTEEAWRQGEDAFRLARDQHPEEASLLGFHALHQFGGYLEYFSRRASFPEEARGLTRRALRIDPQNPLARLAGAFGSYVLRREDECLERTLALARDPTVPRSLQALALSACLALGQGIGEAYPLLRRITADLTHYPRLVHTAAFAALLSRGENHLAEQELARAYSEGQWVERLGRIALAQRGGRREEARAHARNLRERFPDFPEYGPRMLERRFATALREPLQTAWERTQA